MNPYDFVRIDWQTPPERHAPIWHHRLTGSQKLYSGTLALDIYAETPLFIGGGISADPKRAASSQRNAAGAYIIPGSSLKGLLRNVVETLGNGCLTLFDTTYERNQVDYRREVKPDFLHCDKLDKLCLTCRMFGMLKDRERTAFMGKVTVSDAVAHEETVHLYEPIYTIRLMEPKPHHASFYLDEERKRIAGRKYYFHHNPDKEPAQESHQVHSGGKPANRHIQPIDVETRFSCQLEFSNLEEVEFNNLMLAVTLEPEMRHKIGYGKPMGLGSIEIRPTHLSLIDYRARYSRSSGENRGRAEFKGNDFWNYINEPLNALYKSTLNPDVMDDLRRIWAWPPDREVQYAYPSKRDWFDTAKGRGKRIADTWDA